MKLNPKGNIVYRGEEIKKLKNIKGIILEKNDEELYQIYRKTVRGNNVAMVFARIRDFGLTYAVFNEPFTFNIQPVPLVLGLGGLATNLSLRKKTQRNLEELVETHNQIYIKEQYGK